MKEAKTVKNADGKDIVIFQNGDRGMYIGVWMWNWRRQKNETLFSMGLFLFIVTTLSAQIPTNFYNKVDKQKMSTWS
jgi:hypothetical protein